jgi:hypothetical protein
VNVIVLERVKVIVGVLVCVYEWVNVLDWECVRVGVLVGELVGVYDGVLEGVRDGVSVLDGVCVVALPT